MAELFGWVSNLLFITGAIILARHNAILSQKLNLVANIICFFAGVFSGLYFIMFISVFLSIVNIYGIYSWNKERHNGKT